MRELARFEGAAGCIVCDTRQFPYVVMRTFGSLDIGMVDAYGDWQRGLFDRMTSDTGRCVWISDIQAEVPTHAVRRHVAQRRSQADPDYARWVVRELIVVDNAMARGVFTVFRMVNPRLTVEMFATLDKALDRGRALLQDVGVVAPRIGADLFSR